MRVLRFAIIICLACSLVVSAAAVGLRDRQEANLLLDKRKNILKSVNLFQPGMTEEEVNRVYADNMVGLVLTPDGKVLEGRDPADVDPDREPDLLLLYERVEDGEVTGYTFPVQGKGLWSTLYGYFALEADLNKVKGLTFYQHGETPGLGGEIEKDWFLDQFVGKEVRDEDGTLTSVTVVKGKAADKYSDPEELIHAVDGISGATITSNGVTALLRKALDTYEPYFSQLRSGGKTT
jgi:Na+-transporting NADH:ubiquinone oxidoreductase subunit C